MAPKIRSAQRREQRREQLWPDVESKIWPPQDKKVGGWAKVPRITPLVLAIIDQSGERKKKEDVSRTYLELLCRNMDEGLIEVSDENEAAVMSGFTGTRRERSWQERIRALEDLGLIETKKVGGHTVGAILMLDPLPALNALRREGKVADELWHLLQKRLLEVRSLDIGDPLGDGGGGAKVVPISKSKKRAAD